MAATEPLLPRAMSYYDSSSDTVKLLREKASVNMATTSAGGGEVKVLESEGEGSLGSKESSLLRKRGTSGETSLSGESVEDGFFRIEDNDPVALALQRCEKWVLRPYRILLRVLGWKQFTRDGDRPWMVFLRVCLMIAWTLFLITTSLTQILSCFPRDRFTPGRRMNSGMSSGMNGGMNDTDSEMNNAGLRVVECREHIISNFIFFDLLLLATYWFGVYLFSQGETEYLSNLAEKVFIKQATSKKTTSSNRTMITTILAFFVVGGLWILVSFAVRLMTARTVRLFEDNTIIRWNDDTEFKDGGKLVLILLSLFGFFTFDTVYVTAVMNYAAQSEMLVHLLRSVRSLVEDKEYEDLDKAMKDIIEIRKYLRVLNGKTAALTALILYNLGSAGVLAIVTLDEVSMINIKFGDYFNEALATVTAGLNVLLWMGLVCFPFIQAARVTDECMKLKETGTFIRTRPLQYSKAPLLELDSYVSFTQAVKLRASMFGIPIHPWMVYLVLVAFTFTMLVLFQTGVYSFSIYL